MMKVNIFEKTRIRLTFWYVVIILVISGSLSGLFYQRTSQILDAEFARIQTRLQNEHLAYFRLRGNVPPVPQIIEAEIVEAKRNIAKQLLALNGGIVLIVAAGGYLLSSKTLKPIEQSMEKQKRFVSDAAHEMRTPITALKTSLEVNLMDKRLSKKAMRILRENLEDVSNLEALTEGLLKLTKREENGVDLVKVNLGESIESAIRTLNALSNKSKVNMIFKQDTEYFVKGEKDLLKELFIILIDNAIKYGKKDGWVKIQVKKAGRNVLVSVKDDGRGISKHHLPHVFDRFYRVDESRSKEGYGLGLSIAKKIVEQHKGEIKVKSEIGKGTEFSIILQEA